MNLKAKNVAVALLILVAGYACKNEEKFQVSDDGFQYKFVRTGEGDTLKEGDVIFYNMKYTTETDSMLYESKAGEPTPIPYNAQYWDQLGPLYKAFKMIKKGDSIIIKIPTKSLFEESFRAQIPPGINADGEIIFYIGAEKVMSQEELQAEAMERMEAQKGKDEEIIEGYLKEKGLTAKKTDSGLRYIVEKEGTGANPKPGDNVSVHYTGMLLDGTKFDSSLDRNEPISFVIGQGQVIRGWDEGIALLKQGGKAKLIIPSSLAYGERGAGGVIPPNSVLIFDVELVDIKENKNQ